MMSLLSPIHRCAFASAAHRALPVLVASSATLAVAVSLVSPRAARAQTTYISYGSTNQGGANFGTLDLQTGTITFIGASSAAVGGLGFGTNGTLYGLAKDGNLYTVDVTNGATTLVGPTGSGTESDWGMSSSPDGTLYAYEEGSNVYTLDQTTGARTLLGSQGFSSSGGYASNVNGVLYSTQGNKGNGFYSVNTSTGAGTLIGTLTNPGNAYALTFASSGLYGIDDTGDIFSINTANAAQANVSTYDEATYGIVNAAITSKASGAAAAPEPGSLALLALSALPAIGVVARRRRKAA